MPGRTLVVSTPPGTDELISYDKLIVGTGAVPATPPTVGPAELGPADGVHLLHSMGDTFALMRTIKATAPASAIIIGAGYIGLEMADALTTRSLTVTQTEQLPEEPPAADPGPGARVHAELARHSAEVPTGTTARHISKAGPGQPGRLRVDAAGDRATTCHRLPGDTYLPPGTTAHKQGRTAGENALGRNRQFAGSLGTQVVKIFDQAVARTGPRDHEAAAAGFAPVTVTSQADDHKAYHPGSHRTQMRVTGDRPTGRPPGPQPLGHRHAEIAKRTDIAATATYHGMTTDAISHLDLPCTPPPGNPREAAQISAQAWHRQVPALST